MDKIFLFENLKKTMYIKNNNVKNNYIYNLCMIIIIISSNHSNDIQYYICILF